MFTNDFIPAGPTVCYGRVSTADQFVETQSEAMLDYLKRWADLELVHEPFTDPDTSGSIPFTEREGGKALARFINTRPKDSPVLHVVVWHFDRFGRDMVDSVQTMRHLWERGITPHCVTVGPLVRSPFTEAFVGFMAINAQLERDLIVHRTRQRMVGKRERGEATGGTVPYGWNHVPDPSGRKSKGGEPIMLMEANQPEQMVISRMKGWLEQHLNYNQIMHRLNRDGVPTKGGGRWTHSRVKSVLESKQNVSIPASH